ncbi:MAG: prepilin-type N-terminal cleavage/methylation domain-containing protein [Trueperaceae bacterium]
MNRRTGFTLLEVVVAGGLLTVAVLALIMVQAQALHAQRRVRVIREIVGVAEGELERRIAAAVPGSARCSVPADASSLVESCQSLVEACTAVDEPCGGASADRAQRVTVTVSGNGGQRFELRAIAARFPPPP